MTFRRYGLGLLCLRCGEPFAPHEYGIMTQCIEADGALASAARHRECEMRAIIGSVGHLLRKCSCYGGNEEDPPGLSERDAARALVEVWESGNWPA
jgi:hypothetical protein